MNKLIQSLSNLDTADKLEAVAEIDALYSELSVEDVRDQINAARAKSKFPAVQDVAAIKDELKNIRDDVRGIVQDTLKAMTHSERAEFADDFADMIIDDDDFGIIAEDFFDSYRLEMSPFLDTTRKKIISLLNKIKVNAHAKFTTELAAQVKDFADAMRPLDKFSIALGMEDFAATEKIFYTVRDVAINLNNEKHLINDPLILTRMLEKNFSYLPHLAELIREDVNFLQEAQARRPTQDFIDAKSTLDVILKAINDGVRFEENAAQMNLKFYHEQFKARHEVTLRNVLNRQGYKPDELKTLNAVAAIIYLRMGTALTWTNRAEFALETFQKALPYAEASGDAKLIAFVRKRVDEWSEIIRQIAKNRESSNSGCWIWIVIIVVIFLLTH